MPILASLKQYKKRKKHYMTNSSTYRFQDTFNEVDFLKLLISWLAFRQFVSYISHMFTSV